MVDIAMVPNVSLLRQLGVPHYVISSFLLNHPCVAFNIHTRFVEAVHKVKEMGFNPLKTSLQPCRWRRSSDTSGDVWLFGYRFKVKCI